MIEWLVETSVGQQPQAWLSAQETAVFDALATPKRRQDWLLGRWTAKRLLQGFARKSGGDVPPYAQLSILAAADGAPEIWLGANGSLRRANSTISISHAHGVSFCALVSPALHALGADIEAIEPRSRGFVRDYFTAGEIAVVEQVSPAHQDCLVTAVWSGKEAALKAVRTGLRADTRTVSCSFPVPFSPGHDWQRFSIQWCGGDGTDSYPPLVGWWRVWQRFILTLAVSPAPGHTLSIGQS